MGKLTYKIIFGKKKNKRNSHGTPLTDAEILAIRKKMNIKVKNPKKYRMGGHLRAL